VSVAALSAADGAHAGASFRFAIEVTVQDGWHVHAHKPLDEFLIPTDVELELPEGFAVSDVVYPEPVRITSEFSEEPLLVYGGTFRIGVQLDLADSAPVGDHAVSGKVSFQACDDKQCVAPSSQAFKLAVAVRPADQALTAQNAGKFKGISFKATEEPPAQEPKPEKTPETPPAEEPKPAEAAETPPAEEPEPEETAEVVTQDEDWTALVDRFDVVASSAGYQRPGPFIEFLNRASGDAPATDTGAFAGKALWLVVLLVLVGGLLLNLTPCVLPLIPINLGIIGAGAQAGSKSRGFALGGLYGLGIALVYGALGLVVILGAATAFGALNATPAFNAVIAVLFVVLALAMFDVILIDFTRFQAKIGGKGRSKGAFFLAFFMGSVSALLAGACVAPVVISTILYAQNLYAKGTTAALLLPFLLGVGMALPWPFAGAGLSFLPKPGKWMVRVKQVFGVFILVMAAYYGYLAVTLFMGPRAGETDAPAADARWTASLSEGLQRAIDEDRPVVIDFWATWCKNCTTMDKTTFKDADVKKALDAFVPIKYQAEDPSDVATQAVLDHFEVIGLPTYVILRPKPPAEPPAIPRRAR